ncbi:hypothetical protein [Streptomyces sp. NRRL F-5123]|uniref:hypothetical protein n=1 Tax=Streptomyces sp. NRRL F-5123 TaxID=1463856 RepID=UPI00131C2785|nr:hypothetical protein [Streptomyces sp. NRRL F-5123]
MDVRRSSRQPVGSAGALTAVRIPDMPTGLTVAERVQRTVERVEDMGLPAA